MALKRLPKEAFYRHLALTNALKEKFVSDVDRIMVENSFTKQTLNLTASAETKEILLLSVRLKKQEFDGKVTEAIARQNKHRLVFLLCFESRRQLALYYGKLYRTPWMEASDVHRLRNLEAEHNKLKRMYADLALMHSALKDVVERKL